MQNIYKLKTYEDRSLDRQVEELCNANNTMFTGLAVYADNTAAVAGGMVAGQIYRTSAGVVMVVV